MKYGPVDVVVVAMGEPRFDGSLMAELERLAGTGTIRVLDAMVLINDESGEQWTLDIEDMPKEDQDALGFIETGTRGIFDGEDAAVFFEGMAPGSAIVALAIENAWVVPLVDALEGVGAELALHTRIPGPIVDDALEAIASDSQ